MKSSLVGVSLLLSVTAGCAHHTQSTAHSRAASPPASEPAPPQTAQQQQEQPANTAANAGDQGLTPSDQGENERDLALTQQIRKAVIRDDSLSFEAKNVKIITRGGDVTLRGPVKSKTESQTIERAAKQAAGESHVTNQLEVENQ